MNHPKLGLESIRCSIFVRQRIQHSLTEYYRKHLLTSSAPLFVLNANNSCLYLVHTPMRDQSWPLRRSFRLSLPYFRNNPTLPLLLGFCPRYHSGPAIKMGGAEESREDQPQASTLPTYLTTYLSICKARREVAFFEYNLRITDPNIASPIRSSSS